MFNIKFWLCSISDQGREFINSVNTELQRQLGTISSAYHLQTNGLVEKLNSTVQSCLLKRNKAIGMNIWRVFCLQYVHQGINLLAIHILKLRIKGQPNESFSNVFRIHLLVPLTGKPFYPLKSRLPEKDERYAFDDN